MRRSINIWLIIYFSAFGNLLSGQDSLMLPALVPAHMQAFSPQTDFSRLSFSDAYLGKDGRLWLNTGNVEKTIYSLPLAQFDGYQFLPVNLDQLQIPEGSYINLLGLEKDDKLNGYFYGREQEAFFSYDLRETQAELFSFANHFPKGSMVRSALQVGKEEWLFFVKSADNLLIYRKMAEEIFLESEISYPFISKMSDFHQPRAALKNNSEIWFIDHTLPIVRWNENTGRWKKYEKEDFDFRLRIDPYYELKWWWLPNPILVEHDGEILLCLSAYDKAPFFRLDVETDRFVPLTEFPADWRAQSLFKDESGNLIYLFKDERGNYKGVLEDSAGKQFDFSAFLTMSAEVKKLVGRDFKRQFLICTDAGLYSAAVRQPDAVRKYRPGGEVRAMAQLSDGKYLISTGGVDSDGWNLLDDARQKLSSFSPPTCGDAFSKKVFRRNAVVLENDRILINDENKFVLYDSNTGECQFFLAGEIYYFTFVSSDTLAYWEEDEKMLAFYDFKTKENIPYLENGRPKRLWSYIQEMKPSRDGQLWIVTTNGLWKVDYRNGQSRQIGFESGFTDSRFTTMYEEENGRIWLGSYLGGLQIYDPQTEAVKVLNQEQGLTNNTIVSILKDDEGVFWIGTYNGISLVSAEGEIITNIREPEGLIGHEFNRYAYLKDKNGRLLLGTTEGLNVIDPQLLKKQLLSREKVQLYLTEAFFYNSDLKKETRLWRPRDFEHTIELPAGKRYLRLQYALSSYIGTDKNQYAYKLTAKDRGHTTNWVYLGGQRDLSLTNLPAGKYEIWLKGGDYKGNWNTEPLRLSIHAREFFYKQSWFYLLVGSTLFLVAFFWIRRLRFEKMRLEKEVYRRTQQIREDKELIEEQALELRQLDELKSRFFTNISHELRTPLTLITAPVEQLLRKSAASLNDNAQHSLRLVLNNGRKLLRLVEELLDLSRLEADKVELQETPTPLLIFCRRLFSAFQSKADFKQIDYAFYSDLQEQRLFWVDQNRLEKIVDNLLSNALKFTPAQGKVRFRLTENPDHILIQVRDSGRGIPPEDLPHIFERYFQTKQKNMAAGGGLGVGLALSSELARLMKGELSAQSEWGKGAVFELRFPARIARGEQMEALKMEATPTIAPENIQKTSAVPAPAAKGSSESSVLIVEDNPDMQQLIQSLLAEDYNCHVANHGVEAWTLLQKGAFQPEKLELIISDVMMPEMDGYTFLNHLKEDPVWQKTPVVMLTARSAEEDKLKALRLGVDDYLTKPFSPQELQVRTENLINNVRRRRQFLRENSASLNVRFEAAPSADQLWLQELETAAKKALDKKLDLTKTYLAGQMALSERQLLRRLKSLTGLTIQKYILEVKLQKARHLLENKIYQTTAEVSYACGFNSPGYFSQLFEKHYGKRPTEY